MWRLRYYRNHILGFLRPGALDEAIRAQELRRQHEAAWARIVAETNLKPLAHGYIPFRITGRCINGDWEFECR